VRIRRLSAIDSASPALLESHLKGALKVHIHSLVFFLLNPFLLRNTPKFRVLALLNLPSLFVSKKSKGHFDYAKLTLCESPNFSNIDKIIRLFLILFTIFALF
jgi:hypothetical protein